jgi:hypothetical protein
MPALLDLLEHDNPETRLGAVEWLGEMRREFGPALPALEALAAQKGHAPEMAAALAKAIGKIKRGWQGGD